MRMIPSAYIVSAYLFVAKVLPMFTEVSAFQALGHLSLMSCYGRETL